MYVTQLKIPRDISVVALTMNILSEIDKTRGDEKELEHGVKQDSTKSKIHSSLVIQTENAAARRNSMWLRQHSLNH